MALWFAARGKGEIEKDGKMEVIYMNVYYAKVIKSSLAAYMN